MEITAGEMYEGKHDNKLTEASFFLSIFVCVVVGRT